ncbi:hypothetical protein AAC387_Pa02g2644 [Persea americana]
MEFYTLTKMRTLGKANKSGERGWNEEPYKMGDGQSMLGVKKTAHCILLLETGGQLGPHQGATHEQYRKDMSLFLFLLFIPLVSPPILWNLQKSKNIKLFQERDKQKGRRVWQTSSIAHSHFLIVCSLPHIVDVYKIKMHGSIDNNRFFPAK